MCVNYPLFTKLLDASHSESVGPTPHVGRDVYTFNIALDIVHSTPPALSAIVAYYSYYDHEGVSKGACCERSPRCREQIPTGGWIYAEPQIDPMSAGSMRHVKREENW